MRIKKKNLKLIIEQYLFEQNEEDEKKFTVKFILTDSTPEGEPPSIKKEVQIKYEEESESLIIDIDGKVVLRIEGNQKIIEDEEFPAYILMALKQTEKDSEEYKNIQDMYNLIFGVDSQDVEKSLESSRKNVINLNNIVSSLKPNSDRIL